MLVSKVHYQYRDASNYKFWDYFLVAGKIEHPELERYMINGEFFVPKHLGLKRLVPEIMNEDDHEWHEITEINYIDGEAEFKKAELLERMRQANLKGWPV